MDQPSGTINIIDFLAKNNISIDFNVIQDISCYRQQSACNDFSFNHPNENSDCCDEDQMLPGVGMRIRFWSIINAFGNYNQEDWKHIHDNNNNVYRIYDEMPGLYKCICSHNISQLEFLQHIPTGIILMMGSECINKIDKRFNKQTKVCSICKKGFGNTDKRKQPFRSGFCSFTCKIVDEKRKQEEMKQEQQGSSAQKQKEKKQQGSSAQQEEEQRLKKKELQIYLQRQREEDNRLQEKYRQQKQQQEDEEEEEDSDDSFTDYLGFESIKLDNENKLPLKDLPEDNKNMTHLNIHPFDRRGLSQEDKHKLSDYEVTDFLTLRTGDHFRYTNSKYQEKGHRKLAYGVVHGVDRENKILEVNGYTTHDEEQKYPNWNIDINNRYKQYIFYKKKKYI